MTADLERQSWREDAACLMSGVEFVDVPADVAAQRVRIYCHCCPVVPHCRAQGDRLAPHQWRTVMGARIYEKGEPADGWPREDVP